MECQNCSEKFEIVNFNLEVNMCDDCSDKTFKI